MASSAMVKILHCLVPLLPCVCLIASLASTVISPTHSNKASAKRFVAFPVKFLFAVLTIAYTCQLWGLSRTYWRLHRDILPSDQFFYSAGSLAIFFVICTTSDRPWFSYAWSSAAAVVPEILLLGFTEQVTDLELYLRVAQISILVFALVLALSSLLPGSIPKDEERQSLLGNGYLKKSEANGSAVKVAAGTEEEEDEIEDTSRDTFVKKKQAERFESSGGWWGYIKPYKIFLPYLVPRGNLVIQFCFVVMMVNLVLERILNVLVPRQVGIVTSHLADSENTGKAPYKQLVIWLFLRWITSQSGLDLADSLASNRFQEYLNAQLTTASLHHVLQLSMDFHDDADSQEVMMAVRQGSGVTRIINQVGLTMIPAIFDLIIAIVYIGHLFGFHASFIILLSGASYMWLESAAISWRAERRRTLNNLNRATGRASNEAMSGWRTVVYFNRILHTATRYKRLVLRTMAEDINYYDRAYLATAASSVIVQVSFALVLILATFLISRGTASVGSFVTLITYWSGVWSPIYRLTGNMRFLSNAFIDAERLLMLFLTNPTIQNKPNAQALMVNEASIRFRGVTFGYDDRKSILKNIDFTAPGGSSVALVGETGSGKSTILKLLHRFYDPSSGSLEIDGQDLRDVTLDTLREVVGIVPQDTILFNQSIMDNVRYGRLNATDEEVYEVCKAAAIHDKILTFPDGYKSKVGFRGVKLSGGENQRVAIARCLLKNPRILLLDEASSAVDSDTEARIQAALKEMCKGRTTIAIAHRLSTIVNSDLILVMHNGEIVERGSHHELLAMNGRYRQLWDKQIAASLDATKEKAEDVVKQ